MSTPETRLGRLTIETDCEEKQVQGPATTAIHAGLDPESSRSRAIVTPIVTSNIYKQDILGEREVSSFDSLT